MKFGKDLEAGIEQKWKTWRSYALCYKEMKRLLPEMTDESDIQQFNEDSDRSVTFWNLYNTSIQSLKDFYDEKLESSTEKLKDLQSRFERLRLSRLPGGRHFSNVDTIELLLENYIPFQEETNLILEFLDINQTACRKILKKYDKRTRSSVKDEQMAQLLETHGFLFGGGLMAGIKFKTDIILQKVKGMQSDYETNATKATPARIKVPQYSKLSEAHMQEAELILEEVENSNLFSCNHKRQNAVFSRQEIEVGEFLGSGEFGEVHEIKAFHVKDTCPICFLHRRGVQEESRSPSGELTSEATNRKSSSVSSTRPTSESNKIENIITFAKYQDNTKSDTDLVELEDDHVEEAEELVFSRGFMNEHCFRNGIARYALKEVKTSLKGRALLNGAIDICIETKFLSVLSHPNIIRLCGNSQIHGCDPRSFIILDRLYGTLGDKIESWRKQVKKFEKGFFGASRHKQDLNHLWNERLLAMYDISRAMKYLHSHQIIYRDLKPENAGFDIHDNVKLFDFGLAKELQPQHRLGEDLYKASGQSGTRRYMSPEVALCKPYGKSADIYSFSILLWECLSLTQPFESMGIEQHAKLVVKGGKRPQIPSSWPIFLKSLLTESWSTNRLDRPDFDEVCSILKGEITCVEMNLSNRTNDLMNTSICNREIHNP